MKSVQKAQNFSSSKRLIFNAKNFFKISPLTPFSKVGKNDTIFGWGRKKSGLKAVKLATKKGCKFMLLEDGFLRSINFGKAPSFSLVCDEMGIYYDANTPSSLENLLNFYDFKSDKALMESAKRAIELIKELEISKYNLGKAPPKELFGDVDERDFDKDGFLEKNSVNFCENSLKNSQKFTENKINSQNFAKNKQNFSKNSQKGEQKNEQKSGQKSEPKSRPKRVLIIAQSARDASLKYGFAERFSSQEMINDAINENPQAQIFLKIHPEAISGKKKSDIDINSLPKSVKIISQNYNPIALLKHFDKVYTKASTMGFETLLLGCECVCYALPFYAGWGLTRDKIKCERRTRTLKIEELFAGAYLLYTRYFNPYKNAKSDIFESIFTLEKYKKIELFNSNRLFFLGFSLWKRRLVKPFFQAQNNEMIFLNSLQKLKKFTLDKNDKIFIWGRSYEKAQIREFSGEIQVFFVEDGFIRSVLLGSDLTRPLSLNIDSKALYIDASKESDLECILQNYAFDENLKSRAKALIQSILANKISKYNNATSEFLRPKTSAKIILIPAQVEDDASMILGGFGLSTQALIERVRKENPNAYIVFKPHPDVLSGNRKGLKDEKIILKSCDEIIKNASIASCLDAVDEVHTITSTVGFEGILHGKVVVCYGLPFYAGWGLTRDKIKCERRTRLLSVEDLVAGALLLYPRYVDAQDLSLCEAERCLEKILLFRNKFLTNKVYNLGCVLRIKLLRKARRLYESLEKWAFG